MTGVGIATVFQDMFGFDRWKRCPSTHCERRGECASPRECCVKSKRPEWERAVLDNGEVVFRKV